MESIFRPDLREALVITCSNYQDGSYLPIINSNNNSEDVTKFLKEKCGFNV
jgi:hypothetical protein